MKIIDAEFAPDTWGTEGFIIDDWSSAVNYMDTHCPLDQEYDEESGNLIPCSWGDTEHGEDVRLVTLDDKYGVAIDREGLVAEFRNAGDGFWAMISESWTRW